MAKNNAPNPLEVALQQALARKAEEQRVAKSKEGRMDVLDTSLARNLGIDKATAQQAGQGVVAHVRELWHETFLSDRWHDGDFMDDVRQATLRGAHPAAQLLFYALLACAIVFVAWASFARLDEITHGQGQVIPSGKVQAVGSPEGGVVKEILVRSGDVVEPGQVLVRLDNAQALSGVGEKVGRREFLAANIARLQAEVEGTELAFPASLISQTELMAEVTKLYQNRQSEIATSLQVLREQAEQRQQELNDARRKANSLSQALKLAQDEYNLTKPYFESGAISKVDVLRLERAVVDARKEYNTATSAIPAAEAALREANGKVEEANLKFKNEARDELGKMQEEFSRLGEGVQAEVARLDRTVLKSPVRAEVKQVLVNTVGQAVGPNTNIVELVPLEDSLLIEARIKPQDVAFIRPGLDVSVKITAYDFAIYGDLKGKVESISADSFTDEKSSRTAGGQPETYFKVNVRTTQNALVRYGKKFPIKSGMVATVDIVTGQKTVLQYLLKPINKARERALTER
jgi:adhesin transport system membrane fusion protein